MPDDSMDLVPNKEANSWGFLLAKEEAVVRRREKGEEEEEGGRKMRKEFNNVRNK